MLHRHTETQKYRIRLLTIKREGNSRTCKKDILIIVLRKKIRARYLTKAAEGSKPGFPRVDWETFPSVVRGPCLAQNATDVFIEIEIKGQEIGKSEKG